MKGLGCTSLLKILGNSTVGSLQGCSNRSARRIIQEIAKGSYNFLLIGIDTLRKDHLGCYGYPRNTSPNIDQLASESYVFENIFDPSGWTAPSFTSLLTGQYVCSHRMDGESLLDPQVIPLQEMLLKEGYRTRAIIQKSYVSSIMNHGLRRGFEAVDIHTERYTPEKYLLAADWIRIHRKEPFFLFLHTFDVHGPYTPPSPYHMRFVFDDYYVKGKPEVDLMQENFLLPRIIPAKRSPNRSEIQYHLRGVRDPEFLRARYDGCIAYVDHELKRIFDCLSRYDLWEKTVVIITSDHGENLGEHDWYGHTIFYRQTTNVPLIIRIPGTHTPGSIEALAQLEDIAPTLYDLSGSTAAHTFQGHSLYDLLTGQTETVREAVYAMSIFWSFIIADIGNTRYKLVLDEGFSEKRFERPLLFNLSKNFDETTDHHDSLVSIRDLLQREFLAWKKRYESKAGGVIRQELDAEFIEDLKAFGYLR